MTFQIRIFLVALLFWCSAQMVVAQEDSTEVALTDADWTKYAQIEVLTSKFLSEKTKELKKWISEKEELGGGARYNQIKGVWGNVKKEIAIGLTEKEREAYQEVLAFQNSIQKMIITYQADLIRDEKLLGLKLFEQISKAIQDNPSLKEKLVQEVAQLKKKKS
ncbi:MAG: hypothetical protein O2829_05165 [Bacteroidetes bacterium]|nr:hypothetical protein [Bacteroidota bacterium]MDA1268466.1 hypothetical protein [Bacteroidota bacterium]